jgi:hypothetical protein
MPTLVPDRALRCFRSTNMLAGRITSCSTGASAAAASSSSKTLGNSS